MKFLSIRFRVLAVLIFLLASGQGSKAQDVLVGFKGGFVLNNDMREVSRDGSESNRGEFGPVVEFKWLSGFAVETSLLYRGVGYNSVSWGIPSDIAYRVRANSWEVPIAAKYYFVSSHKNAQAFVSGGYVLRALTGAMVESQTLSYPEYETVTYRGAADVTNSFTPGVTFGVGGQFGSGRIRFSPEIRYTRWLLLPFDEEGSKGYRVHSAANQLNFLVSVAFVARKAAKVP